MAAKMIGASTSNKALARILDSIVPFTGGPPMQGRVVCVLSQYQLSALQEAVERIGEQPDEKG